MSVKFACSLREDAPQRSSGLCDGGWNGEDGGARAKGSERKERLKCIVARPPASEADSLTSGDIRLGCAVGITVRCWGVRRRTSSAERRRTRRRPHAPSTGNTAIHAVALVLLVDSVGEVALRRVEAVVVDRWKLDHAPHTRNPTVTRVVLRRVRGRRRTLRRVL